MQLDKAHIDNISSMEKKLAYSLIFGLWTYVILRAFLITITIDEAATFFHYVQPQQWRPGVAYWDANNHLLNSILSIWSYRVFGADEWALRLPNVLAGLLYLILAWKISVRVNDRIFRWSLFLSLSMCSFLLEFFGLTRGYGMSMAFLLLAIHGFLKWQKTSGTLQLVIVLIGIGLMIMANMSLLVTGLITVGVVLAHLVASKSKNWLQYILLASTAFGFYLAIQHSFNMKERGLLYYGQGSGFWHVTVTSLTHIIYKPFGDYSMWILPLVFVIVAGLAIKVISQSRFSSLFSNSALLPLALLFGNLLANFSMNWLLGVNFPEDRVALAYIPFLFISLFFLVDQLKMSRLKLVLVPLALLLPLQLLFTANVSQSMLWSNDRALPIFLELANERKDAAGLFTPVEAYGLRKLGYDYLTQDAAHQVRSMRPYNSNGYLANLILTDNFQEHSLSDYQMIEGMKWGKLQAYQQKTPWKPILVKEGTFTTDGQSDAQFKEFVNISLPKNRPAGYLFVPDITVLSDNTPLQVSMVGQISNKEHQRIDDHELGLDRIHAHWAEETTDLSQAVLLDTRSDSAAHLKVFLWNREMEGSYSAKGTWKLYELR